MRLIQFMLAAVLVPAAFSADQDAGAGQAGGGQQPQVGQATQQQPINDVCVVCGKPVDLTVPPVVVVPQASGGKDAGSGNLPDSGQNIRGVVAIGVCNDPAHRALVQADPQSYVAATRENRQATDADRQAAGNQQ